MTHRIGVIGSGSWGTALAVHLAAHRARRPLVGARCGARVEMSASRENRAYLPGIELPSALAPTSDMRVALDGAQFVVIAVPSHGVRDVARLANPHLPNGCAIVSATKGLEEGSLLRMSQVLRQEFTGRRRRGRALRSEFRKRAGAQAADRDCRGRRLAGGRRVGDGALSIAGASALWKQRRHRRRTPLPGTTADRLHDDRRRFRRATARRSARRAPRSNSRFRHHRRPVRVRRMSRMSPMSGDTSSAVGAADAPFTLAELDDVAELVGRFVPPTPQFAWPLLADAVGTDVWVKHENHTPDRRVQGPRRPRLRRAHVRRARRIGRHQRDARQPRPEPRLRRPRATESRSTSSCPPATARRRTRRCARFGATLIEHGHDFQAAREHAGELAPARPGDGAVVPPRPRGGRRHVLAASLLGAAGARRGLRAGRPGFGHLRDDHGSRPARPAHRGHRRGRRESCRNGAVVRGRRRRSAPTPPTPSSMASPAARPSTRQSPPSSPAPAHRSGERGQLRRSRAGDVPHDPTTSPSRRVRSRSPRDGRARPCSEASGWASCRRAATSTSADAGADPRRRNPDAGDELTTGDDLDLEPVAVSRRIAAPAAESFGSSPTRAATSTSMAPACCAARVPTPWSPAWATSS